MSGRFDDMNGANERVSGSGPWAAIRFGDSPPDHY
jgi:hypothetical protein